MDTLQQLAKDKCKSWGSSSAICEADYIKTFQDDIRENVSPATAPAAVSPTGPTQVTGLIDGKVTPDDIKRIGENCRNEEDLDTCMRRTIASWQGGNLDGNDIEKINQYIAQGAPTPASTSDAPTGEMGPFISNYQRAVRYCDGTGYISEADINQCQIDVEHRLDIGESMVAPAVNLGQIAPQSDISRITQPCANRAGNGDCLDQSNPTYCLPSILSIFNGSWNNCANGVQGAEQPHASVQEGPTAQQPPAPVEKITTFFPAQTPVAQSCISYAANGDCTGYLQPATGLLKSFQDSVSNFFSSGSQTAPVQQISTQASGWGATPAPSVSRYDKGGELSGYIIPRFSGPAGQATGPVQSSEPAQPAAQEVAPSTESAQTPTDIVDQENNPQNTIQQGYTETVIPFYGNFGGDGANLDELLQQPDSLQMFDNGTSNLNGVLIDWSLMYGKPTRQFSAAEPSNPLQNQSLAASAFGALVPIITDTRN
ncbi:MAG: hypothetical protein Q7S08_04830 [bacterium]|nr:hypothetical protein [bacterium]